MMRILEINKFFYPRRGAERHFLDLVSALRVRGYEVAVLAMDDPRNVTRGTWDRFVSSVGYNADDSTLWQKVIGIGRLFWSWESRWVMRRLLDEFQPEVVHIHNAYHQLSFSFLSLIRARNIPILLTVHDYHLISPDKDAYYPEVGQAYWKFLFVKKYSVGKRFLLVAKSYWERIMGFREMIDRYIAPSEYVRQVLISGGLSPEKIVVIPHFVNELDGDLAVLPHREPYALYFGGITAEKNILELVDVFERLRYRLVLAGTKRMDIPESPWVHYVGERSAEDLVSLIRGASCVVSASRLPETFGLIVLEANIAGRPFFGYRTGAFPELVENGLNGYLTENKREFEKNIEAFFAGNLPLASGEAIARATRDRYAVPAYLAKLARVVSDMKQNIA